MLSLAIFRASVSVDCNMRWRVKNLEYVDTTVVRQANRLGGKLYNAFNQAQDVAIARGWVLSYSTDPSRGPHKS